MPKVLAYEVVVTPVPDAFVAEMMAKAIRNAQGGERLFADGIGVEVREIMVDRKVVDRIAVKAMTGILRRSMLEDVEADR